jgi:hypothetical protein
MIPTYIIDRIAASELSGHRIATLLFNMAEAVEQLGIPGGTLGLDFAAEGDPIQPGDLIPQIHLALKRVQPPDPPAEPSNEEPVENLPGYPAPETVVEIEE